MELYYTLRDAEAWAAFSGDYNPIHFDLHHAHKHGMEQLCVHGMRAMLDIKRYLSEALLCDPPESAHYLSTTRMRRKLLCRTPYHLQIVPSDTAFVGQLLNNSTKESYFNSKLVPAGSLRQVHSSHEQILSSTDIIISARRFPGSVFLPAQCWIFFDALLFQILMKSTEMWGRLATSLPMGAFNTLSEMLTQLTVVQTHHETHFSSRLLTTTLHEHLEKSLSVSIQPDFVMGDPMNGFIFRPAIQLIAGQHPLMTTTITLKAWSAAIN